MRFVPLLLIPALLIAAEPDWKTVDAESIDLLQRYLRIPSINPPADTRAAAELFKTELARVGIEAKLFEAGPKGQTNLVARLAGKDRAKKPLILMSHFDVVPVDRAAWRMDPFEGVIKDGAIWGRGALDMKGIGIMQLMAVLTMKKYEIVPDRDIVLFATCDEESGGDLGVRWMLKNHPEELEAEYVLDEGGFGTRDVLQKGKLVFGISVAEKQPAWLRIRAKGTAAHGSQPIPDNANMTLLRAIEKAMAAPPSGKAHPIIAEMLKTIGGAMDANKFTNAIQKNTLTLTTMKSGVGDPPRANVIPSTAEATLDCRLLPGVNAQEFISEIRARINDPRVTVELLTTIDDTPATSFTTPLFETLKRVIKKHHPGAEVTPMMVPYSTDSPKFRRKGLPAYGFTPMILTAPILATMHSDEERIPLDQFHIGMHMMFDVIRSEF
ncbi:MAG: M20/M25/M40 family metallo-hydrolase [Acidobacteria bacterium]|nr:M20/M25/M40 family metallo-hydrolase [Acidobacteriota bacterium]